MPFAPANWYFHTENAQPTGRKRHRPQKWTGLMILEIEFVGDVTHMFGAPTGRTRTWWRDARLADLMPTDAREAA